VVVGGTISSALLTLIVLPVSYYWAGVRARVVRTPAAAARLTPATTTAAG